MKTLLFTVARCLVLFLALLAGTVGAQSGKRFDHLSTGFALDTTHSRAACETCHVKGVFKGTPRDCKGCHTSGSRINATTMSANHIPTSQSCDVCHRGNNWNSAVFNHGGIAAGTCTSCHNGTTARGKTGNHIQTSASCDSCHKTSAWLPATFSHSLVAPGSCATCHNGSTARGKAASHIATSQSCDTCHKTTA